MLADTAKSRMASRQVVNDCLFDNGVTLHPDELSVIFDSIAKGSQSLNYLDFISACRGQMARDRETAVEKLFRRIDSRKLQEVKTDDIVSRFKADRHPDVKTLGTEPHKIKSNFSDSLMLFGRLGVGSSNKGI